MTYNFPNTYMEPNAEALLTTHVVAVFAVCSPANNREVQGDAVNHWRLFFVLPGNHSIVLDMVKNSGTDTTGVLGVLAKTYNVTSNRVQQVGMMPGHDAVNVEEVLRTLKDQGCLSYRYNKNGEGCRFWVKTAVRHLEEAGCLAPPAQKDVNAIIGMLWTSPEDGIPKEIGAGEFY